MIGSRAIRSATVLYDDCKSPKANFSCLREAACSFAVFHREEIFSGLWLRYAQKLLLKERPARNPPALVVWQLLFSIIETLS
jgi:hypothetical protein